MSGMLYVTVPPQKKTPNSKDKTRSYFTRNSVISEHFFSLRILISCFEIIKRKIRLPVNESEEKCEYNKLNSLEQ